MNFRYYQEIVSVIIVTAFLTTAAQAQTAITGATLYDGNGNTIEEGTVIVNEGLIVEIGGKEVGIPEDAEVIDAEGKFVTPGLIDAHVHFSSTGFFDTRPNEVNLRDSLDYFTTKAYQREHPDRYYESYLRAGVTGVYDAGGPPWTIALEDEAEENLNAPHIAAAGPLLTKVPKDFQYAINPPTENEMVYLDSPQRARDIVKYNSLSGSTGIKVLFTGQENSEFEPILSAIQEEADTYDNQIIAHAHQIRLAKMALQYGTKVLVHSVLDTLVEDSFYSLMNKNNALYMPTLHGMQVRVKMLKSLLGNEFELNDPNGIVDPKTRSLLARAGNFKDMIDTAFVKRIIRTFPESPQHETARKNLLRVYKAGIPIAVGTDAGIPGVLHGLSIYDEMEAIQEAGIPPSDIIVMATRNGAMTMERLDDFGTLEEGKMADLIILEDDPGLDVSNFRSISHVMRGGLIRSVSEPFSK